MVRAGHFSHALGFLAGALVQGTVWDSHLSALLAGAGVLWLLPIVGLASIREIAGVLDIPAVEMAALWPRLPLDDLTIAERLACTRQQVINLRMAGRKRLATRLRSALGERDLTVAGRGNLTVVSPSMDHDT